MKYNKEHSITPETIFKDIQKRIVLGQVEDGKKLAAAVEGVERAEGLELMKRSRTVYCSQVTPVRSSHKWPTRL